MEEVGQAVSAEKAREIYEDIIGRYNVTHSQFVEDAEEEKSNSSTS